MALVLGTNSGFVTEAPAADPSGGGLVLMDTRARVQLDTSSATAAKITAIIWWCDGATEESNFEVGLYNSSDDMLYSDTVNAKGTTAGWKTVSVDWAISSSTAYKIAVQLDDTATATYIDSDSAVGKSYQYITASSLPDPFGPYPSTVNDNIIAICAVWEAAGGISIPVAMNHLKQQGIS